MYFIYHLNSRYLPFRLILFALHEKIDGYNNVLNWQSIFLIDLRGKLGIPSYPDERSCRIPLKWIPENNLQQQLPSVCTFNTSLVSFRSPLVKFVYVALVNLDVLRS